MKKITYFLLILMTVFVVASCSDNEDNPVEPNQQLGNIDIRSNPSGATIWLDGDSLGMVTPDTLYDLSTGEHTLTLQLQGYRDTTFTIEVIEDYTQSAFIIMERNLVTTRYENVRIYESTGTTVDQPSGLDLSTGQAYGISGNMRDSVDIYYFSNSAGDQFLVSSASQHPDLQRRTYFNISNIPRAQLNGDEDSPLFQASGWVNEIADRQDNVFFLYDEDGHYSKAVISSYGGGTPGNPAWIEITYIYNEQPDDIRFQ